MSKEKSNNYESAIMIPESIVDRFITAMERSVEKETEKNENNEKNKLKIFEDELNFIKSEIKRVEDKMKTLEIDSSQYMDLVRTYDKLMDVIRYIP